MIKFMEPLFDLAYLGIVIALGVRLLLERENKQAKRFGIMALLLGLGDAFHLIPRITSHLSPGGFAAHITLLSWGEFVTSLTMTFFYLLFYFYYRDLSGDRNQIKAYSVCALVAVRTVLVFLPQNGWGTEGPYLFSLIRNIPFALLGILLIVWTGQKRKTVGLRYTSVLILASFLFYLPVVIGARFIPILGLLMIPKTVAYLLLVFVGYKHFVPRFDISNILKMALTFLIMGLVGGVFYREFTKAYSWSGKTALGVVHVHLLALGFLFALILYALLRQNQALRPDLSKPFALYVTGLVWTVVGLMVRGIYQITAEGSVLFPDAILSGIAGIGHILLGIGLVWTMACTLDNLTKIKAEQRES